MDMIKIEGIEVFANHGVFPEENKLGQKFVLSLELHMDTRMAGLTDELEYSVHYGKVAEFSSDFLQKNTYNLIEAAAEHLAQAILLKFQMVREVRVQLFKPWAPIGLPMKSVSVDITRKWHIAYISIGSNIGNKEKYLYEGIKAIDKLDTCKVTMTSKFRETEPYGKTDQDKFLNGALEVETLLSPDELLDNLHDVEQKAGRKRKEHWGPRTLDLDILMYDDKIIQTPDLVIPHMDMLNRKFVLEPMAEIAPYVVHPLERKNMLQLKKKLDKKLKSKAE
ncbi:MAG: 2-amino-4-hydroxy-6-hydroxymethyldihydropteridine diphosphokinase [Lachnospiraceae bacterium]|nr:2-amino-4-hydroxy-6-hydroxymethyldihydropteridine diphosphokinase [Lachnospiraceae bacterium]